MKIVLALHNTGRDHPGLLRAQKTLGEFKLDQALFGTSAFCATFLRKHLLDGPGRRICERA